MICIILDFDSINETFVVSKKKVVRVPGAHTKAADPFRLPYVSSRILSRRDGGRRTLKILKIISSHKILAVLATKASLCI